MSKTGSRVEGANVDVRVLNELLNLSRRAQTELIARSKILVEMESPSKDKVAVDRVISLFADWCRAVGAPVTLHRHDGYGNSVEARFGFRTSKQKPILLLGHLDTVWDVGTLVKMPWKQDICAISGPGALDMKVGVAMALVALEMLKQLKLLRVPVILLLHGDEEVGSPVSRGLTELIARRCQAVYVLEPAQGPDGAYKTARRGVGHYRLEITGVAAHAGVDFEKGHSAIIELAHHVEYISSLSDLARGRTVNVGIIGGGSQSNVVPDRAWASIDVRVTTMAEAKVIDKALKGIRPINGGCEVRVVGGLNRPPMVRSEATVALFERARLMASQMGLEPLEEAATGGGSDGSFTAALGIPTLDGMGAVGAGAHAYHEHVLKHFIAPRTALLAAMLL